MAVISQILKEVQQYQPTSQEAAGAAMRRAAERYTEGGQVPAPWGAVEQTLIQPTTPAAPATDPLSRFFVEEGKPPDPYAYARPFEPYLGEVGTGGFGVGIPQIPDILGGVKDLGKYALYAIAGVAGLWILSKYLGRKK